MPKNYLSEKIRIFLSFLMVFHVLTMGIALGLADDDHEEEVIFPFETSGTGEISDSEDRWVEYTEDLIEVEETGTYDSSGRLVDRVSAAEEEDLLEEVERPKTAFEEYQDSIISNWGSKKAFTEQRLKGIQENLDEQRGKFEELGSQIDEVEEKIAPVLQKIDSLKDQIDLINRQLTLAKDKIKAVEFQVAEKQIAIRDLMIKIQETEAGIRIQEGVVLDYIRLVYQQEEKFIDYFESGSSTLKLLLADNSISENLLGIEYSKILESTGRDVFYDLHHQKLALAEMQTDLEKERAEVEGLYLSLNNERRILEEGRLAKGEILQETLGEESEYQRLLEKSIQERLESAIAIQNLQDNISYIEQKLAILDDSLEQAEALAELPETAETFVLLEDAVENASGVIDDQLLGLPIPKHQAFIWPVPPKAVTAYYQDPTYPGRWGTHWGLDLRAKQFTEIRAPANGYVFQAKDNGLGYSYIILAHKNQLLTVYGHVSDILVKPGTVVKQGDVIGLTGGTPGTKGAGLQTTGPHLHLEVYHKGEHVDPLDYLPVYELPIEFIPERYFSN